MENAPLPGTPPRSVSAALSLRVRFGHGLAVTGFILCGLTLSPVILLLDSFGVDTNVHQFFGRLETTEGQVTRVGFSGTYYGKHRLDKRPVNRVEFTYRTPNGTQHTGYSYGVEYDPGPGARVIVEYPAAAPAIARIRGHSRSLISPWLLLFLLAPGLGLVIGVAGVAAGGRRVRLLRRGVAAQGTIVSEEKTDEGTGSRPLYRQSIEIEGTAAASRNRVAVLTATPISSPADLESRATVEVEPGHVVRLLVDPQRPEVAFRMSDLPGSPQITPRGDFVISPASRPILALAPTALSLVSLVAMVCWWIS